MNKSLVLYVDDEWANRVVFEQTFASRFRVKTVGSAAEALALLADEQPAVVLTDQRMPEMSGHELLAQVKVLYPDTVRIVITAYSDLEPILRAVNEGLVARYLIKPWDRAELEQILHWAIEAHNLGREGSALQLRLLETERLATLGSLASATLHDLRQPLNTLRSSGVRIDQTAAAAAKVQALAREHADRLAASDRANLDEVAEELPEIGQAIRVAVDVMARIVTSLQRFTNPNQPVEKRAADAVPMIQIALSICSFAAQRAHVGTSYEGPPSLPPVRATETDLMQIFINLISNAIQAQAGMAGRRGRVRVRAVDAGVAVRFSVADEGPGIPSEVLEKVGRPYFSTRAEGTGLGVVQCKRLVGQAGGMFEIDSTVGKGTTVTIILPKA
jgi:signal transduction histidine kinase